MSEIKKYLPLDDSVPMTISEPDILYAVRCNTISSTFLSDIKELSRMADDALAKIFDLNIKTFRSYRVKKSPLRPHLQEQAFAIVTLFKHGVKVFGTNTSFNEWLNLPNHYFDNDTPINFLTTISGIKYVDSRLTAIQYGDNI